MSARSWCAASLTLLMARPMRIALFPSNARRDMPAPSVLKCSRNWTLVPGKLMAPRAASHCMLPNLFVSRGHWPTMRVGSGRSKRHLARASSRITEIGGSIDDRFTTEMNAARDLLRKGHARAARLLLDSLSKHVGTAGFTKELHFRLETNLGGSALALGEYEAAEKCFDSALAIQPEDAKALTNRAHIALVRDQTDVGLEYASRARSSAVPEWRSGRFQAGRARHRSGRDYIQRLAGISIKKEQSTTPKATLN